MILQCIVVRTEIVLLIFLSRIFSISFVVSRNIQSFEDGKWMFLGILTFLDPPRPDAKDTIESCRRFGVEVKMITGDHLVIAKETARRVGLGDNILGSFGLPTLEEGSKVPKNLASDYGHLIRPADGFAQVVNFIRIFSLVLSSE